jgi:hypothetical protein
MDQEAQLISIRGLFDQDHRYLIENVVVLEKGSRGRHARSRRELHGPRAVENAPAVFASADARSRSATTSINGMATTTATSK